jgi:hypothetical protein
MKPINSLALGIAASPPHEETNFALHDAKSKASHDTGMSLSAFST